MVEPAVRRIPHVDDSGWLQMQPPAVRFAFQGDEVAQRACLGVWGAEFPQHACRANTHSRRATLWLGPDEYLLLDASADGGPAPDEAQRLGAALEAAMAGTSHSLVDVSHRQFALQVSGPHAAVILNGACPLDLDPAQFPVGMCTRTVFAKADIVLWRTGPDEFHLEVWRSFAGYVTGLLREIASEFHPKP